MHSVTANLPDGESEKYSNDAEKCDILFAKAENGLYYGYEKGDDTNKLYIYSQKTASAKATH